MQDANPESQLNWTRRVIAARNAHPALRSGDLRMRHNDAAVLAFEREENGERLLCLFNMSDAAQAWPEGIEPTSRILLATGELETGTLPAFAGLVLRV